jgi:hypothetical protein
VRQPYPGGTLYPLSGGLISDEALAWLRSKEVQVSFLFLLLKNITGNYTRTV